MGKCFNVLSCIFCTFLSIQVYAQNQQVDTSTYMNNKITLDVDHPNKTRMEYFLNSVNDRLEQVSFDWHGWKQSDKIIAGYKFNNSDSSLVITVLFTSSYGDANEIAKANALPVLPNAKWSVNGDLLYLVESVDENKVSEVLGLFAGKE